MEHTGRCAQNAPRSTSGPLMATDALGRTTPDRAAGVPAELVRMSCGLESSEDLIADIAQALDQI